MHCYQRVAFLRGPEKHEDSYWRELGYREALEAHGIPCDPTLVAAGGFRKGMAQVAVGQWLRDGVEMVCLIRTGQAEPLVFLPTELVIRRSCGCNL